MMDFIVLVECGAFVLNYVKERIRQRIQLSRTFEQAETTTRRASLAIDRLHAGITMLMTSPFHLAKTRPGYRGRIRESQLQGEMRD